MPAFEATLTAVAAAARQVAFHSDEVEDTLVWLRFADAIEEQRDATI